MAKRNQVYSCNNLKCQPFLFNGVALLEITVNGKLFSLNPSLGHLQYYSDDGTTLELEHKNGALKLKSAPKAKCPNCGAEAATLMAVLDFEAQKEDITQKIDVLDNRINDLMKMFQGK